MSCNDNFVCHCWHVTECFGIVHQQKILDEAWCVLNVWLTVCQIYINRSAATVPNSLNHGNMHSVSVSAFQSLYSFVNSPVIAAMSVPLFSNSCSSISWLQKSANNLPTWIGKEFLSTVASVDPRGIPSALFWVSYPSHLDSMFLPKLIKMSKNVCLGCKTNMVTKVKQCENRVPPWIL